MGNYDKANNKRRRKRAVRQRNFTNHYTIVTKSIILSKLQLNGLINLALDKLKSKYNLESYELINNSVIFLKGLENKVDTVIERVMHAFVSMKCERINELSDNSNILTNSKNLNLIIQECLITNFSFKSLIYKIQIIQTSSSNNENDSNGIFLSYFHNCIDLDSKLNNVFTLISEYLNENIIQIKLNNNQNSSFVLNETKWKQFELENSNNFSFVLNEKNVIYLTGIKSYVHSAKDLIENLFNENQLVSRNFFMDRNKVSFYFKFK